MNFYHLMQEAQEVRSNILVLLTITMLLTSGALLALGIMLCMYCHGRCTKGQNPTHYHTPAPMPCVCCEHAALHDQQVRTLSVGTIILIDLSLRTPWGWSPVPVDQSLVQWPIQEIGVPSPRSTSEPAGQSPLPTGCHLELNYGKFSWISIIQIQALLHFCPP